MNFNMAILTRRRLSQSEHVLAAPSHRFTAVGVSSRRSDRSPILSDFHDQPVDTLLDSEESLTEAISSFLVFSAVRQQQDVRLPEGTFFFFSLLPEGGVPSPPLFRAGQQQVADSAERSFLAGSSRS